MRKTPNVAESWYLEYEQHSERARLEYWNFKGIQGCSRGRWFLSGISRETECILVDAARTDRSAREAENPEISSHRYEFHGGGRIQTASLPNARAHTSASLYEGASTVLRRRKKCTPQVPTSSRPKFPKYDGWGGGSLKGGKKICKVEGREKEINGTLEEGIYFVGDEKMLGGPHSLE